MKGLCNLSGGSGAFKDWIELAYRVGHHDRETKTMIVNKEYPMGKGNNTKGEYIQAYSDGNGSGWINVLKDCTVLICGTYETTFTKKEVKANTKIECYGTQLVAVIGGGIRRLTLLLFCKLKKVVLV